jgi:hypothetical protein
MSRFGDEEVYDDGGDHAKAKVQVIHVVLALNSKLAASFVQVHGLYTHMFLKAKAPGVV